MAGPTALPFPKPSHQAPVKGLWPFSTGWSGLWPWFPGEPQPGGRARQLFEGRQGVRAGDRGEQDWIRELYVAFRPGFVDTCPPAGLLSSCLSVPCVVYWPKHLSPSYPPVPILGVPFLPLRVECLRTINSSSHWTHIHQCGVRFQIHHQRFYLGKLLPKPQFPNP